MYFASTFFFNFSLRFTVHQTPFQYTFKDYSHIRALNFAREHELRRLVTCKDPRIANPILETLGASDSVKLNYKTALMLKNSGQESQSGVYMETAIRELEDDALKNHNNGHWNIGSHGSSHNELPLPNPATYSQDGGTSVLNMANTMDQWNVSLQIMTVKAVKEYSSQIIEPMNVYHQETIHNHVVEIKKGRKTIKQNAVKIKELEKSLENLQSNSGSMANGVRTLIIDSPNTITETNANPEDYGFYAPSMGVADNHVQNTTVYSNGGYNGAPILGVEPHQDHYPRETAKRENLLADRMLSQ